MISAILGWLTSGGIAAIGKQINDAYKAKLGAQSEAEVLEANLKISHLEARRDVLLAEQNNWMTRWIRPAIAAPFVIYLWKVIVYDMVFGWGSTAPLSPQLGEIMGYMIGAYFLARPLEKFIRRR